MAGAAARHRDYAYSSSQQKELAWTTANMLGHSESVLVEDSQSQPEGIPYRSRQHQSPESQPFDLSYEQHYSRAARVPAGGAGGGAGAPRCSRQQQQQQDSMGESQISDDLYYHGGGGDDSFQATQQAYTQPAVSQQTAPAGSGGPEPSPPRIWGCLLPNAKHNTKHCTRIELEGHDPSTLHVIGRALTYKHELDTGQVTTAPTHTVINHLKISGTHCKIWREFEPGSEFNALVKIQDCSTNGVFVRGQHLGKGHVTILNHGDEVCFGPPLGKYTKQSEEFRYSFNIESHLRPKQPNDPSLAGGLYLKYTIAQQLGKGTFATVYKAVAKKTGETVAIKVVNKSRFARDPNNNKMLAREVMIMKELKHPYVVKYIDGFEDPDYLWIVLEYVDGGDLLDFIQRKKGLDESEAAEVAYMICLALAYLHQKVIVHRDLKPENILLTADKHPVCKIADFGLAKLANFSVMQTMCGTPAYIAPEVILQDQRQRGYSAAVDSWSLGVIVYACLTNALPFVGENTQDPLPERMEARQPDMGLLDELNISDNAYDFISALMDRNPATRLTPYDALTHPWLNECARRRTLDPDNMSALNAAPLPPVEAAMDSRPAESSVATTPKKPMHDPKASRSESRNLSTATSHASLAHNELPERNRDDVDPESVPESLPGRESLPGAGTHRGAHAAQEDEVDDGSDAQSYSQRLGRMNIGSDVGVDTGESSVMDEDGYAAASAEQAAPLAPAGPGLRDMRDRAPTADSTMSAASGPLTQEAPPDSNGSSAFRGKRKLPVSAFSSEESVEQPMQPVQPGLSMASSGISAAGARFSPEAPLRPFANGPPAFGSTRAPPLAKAPTPIRVLQHHPQAQSPIASTSGQHRPAQNRSPARDQPPARPVSPTSSLSSLSDLSDAEEDADENGGATSAYRHGTDGMVSDASASASTRQNSRRTSPRISKNTTQSGVPKTPMSATATSSSSSKGKGTAAARPRPAKSQTQSSRPVGGDRRRSARHSTANAPSYAESDSDGASGPRASKTPRSNGRARKQRRLSEQPH